MKIVQFEDRNLSHYSYAIISEGEMAVIDPERNPQQYEELAQRENATITTVIETHPHADFVSSHLEIHEKTGATIYVSKLLGAEYPHQPFDDGDSIKLGKATLKALNTPGHSPDSICIVAINEEGIQEAVFTGDTLFIGDCGRPDLREKAGALTAARDQLARQMYHSLRDKITSLPDEVEVYPSHGAGSLCGKGLSDKNTSTMGVEKATNWSLQSATEDEFVTELLANQPFVPKYFGFEVTLNKKGATPFKESVKNVPASDGVPGELKEGMVIIDTRDQAVYKKGYLPYSINLMNDRSFETWLGSIIAPEEKFYLQADDRALLATFIGRAAEIGYERQIEKAFVAPEVQGNQFEAFDLAKFKSNPGDYTIVDIRNATEVQSNPVFSAALHIPLWELRERTNEVPKGKPVVVHCAAGYRSAAGASILKQAMNGSTQVYDLSYAICDFKRS